MFEIPFQLLHRQEIWVLTWQGWLLLLLGLLGLLLGVIPKLHGFLAITATVSAEVLVVDGWLTDDHLVAAGQEFQQRPYRVLLTVGAVVPKGSYLMGYPTFAELSRETLLKMGFPADRVVAIPVPLVQKDRTYASAVAVRDWLEKNGWRIQGVPVQGVNVVTEGTHARRSWRLYQKVFTPRIPIGIIALPSLDYDSRRWWASSEGVKRVIFETLAWIYLQVFNVMD